MTSCDMDKARNELRSSLYNVFPNAIFTTMSVIQGVALYTLVTSFHDVVEGRCGANLCWAGVREYYLYALLSLLGMMAVASEYTYDVTIIRRPPMLSDILLPLVIGIFQIMPMLSLDSPSTWWFTTAVFATAGFFAYMVSFWQLEKEKRGSVPREYSVARRIQKAIKLDKLHSVISFFTVAACWLGAYHIGFSAGALAELAYMLVVAVTIVANIALTWLYYMGPLYKELGMRK